MQLSTVNVVPFRPAAAPPAVPPHTRGRVLDGGRLLEAIGDLLFAAARRELAGMIAAWHRLCEGAGRASCLRVRPPYVPVPLPLAPERADVWAHLADLAIAACRNVRAADADRHWFAAAAAFQQAAANRACFAGYLAASDVATWRAQDWQLEDGDQLQLAIVAEDVIAGYAREAAHFGHLALGDGRTLHAAATAELDAREAMQTVITRALQRLDLQHVACDPFSADGDTLTTCTVCGSVEGCESDCPAVVLSAHHLIGVYADALNGGAR